ncbi:MAG: ATP-binding protein [Chloroflexi bacterium]|nr:ATP-binding protein [Chloroflexota bacterium]
MSTEQSDDAASQTPPRQRFSREDIGGDLLPILTRGLYRDTLDCLREYIQNAIDANASQVRVSVDPDVVSILDDGLGMNADDARKAMRLGISEKNPMVNIGFRGIGIYSGFNLCDSLEVFTKTAKSDTTYRIFFDFKQIRLELLAEQERRSQGKPPSLYLQRLLEESVYVETTRNDIIPHHGSKVLMTGLLPDAYRRLNDWDTVIDYLQNVVPLPFNPDFRFGHLIAERFQKEDYRVIPLILNIGDHSQQLYRPYTNSVFRHGGLHQPEFFDIREGKHDFGFAWVCVNDARETIKDLSIRGLLLKKFGFSIGDRRYLEPYFGRTVYSRRITGEVIVTHPDMIPNAGRSDFEHNTRSQIFAETLPKFTRKVDSWANKLQELDRAKDVLADVATELMGHNKELAAIQRDREHLLAINAQLSDMKRRLKPHRRRLQEADPDGLKTTQDMLEGVERFVREALGSQRRTRRKIEREVVKAVQREATPPVLADLAREENAPADLVELLEAYGLADLGNLRRFLQHLDDTVLKPHLSADRYSQVIKELRDYLEENP